MAKMAERIRSPALVASAFLDLPYAHYIFSRADKSHLMNGIYPLLVGCLVAIALLPGKAKWPLATTVAAASVWIMYLCHVYPNWVSHALGERVNVEISGSKMTVDPNTAGDLALLAS